MFILDGITADMAWRSWELYLEERDLAAVEKVYITYTDGDTEPANCPETELLSLTVMAGVLHVFAMSGSAFVGFRSWPLLWQSNRSERYFVPFSKLAAYVELTETGPTWRLLVPWRPKIHQRLAAAMR